MPRKTDDDKMLLWVGAAGIGAYLLWRYMQNNPQVVTSGAMVSDTGVPQQNYSQTTAPPSSVTTTTITPAGNTQGTINSPQALANISTTPIPLANIGSAVSTAINSAVSSLPSSQQTPATVAQVTEQVQQAISATGTDTVTPNTIAQAVNTATQQVAGGGSSSPEVVTTTGPLAPVLAAPVAAPNPVTVPAFLSQLRAQLTTPPPVPIVGGSFATRDLTLGTRIAAV